ncbi:hypothetical protein M3Y94_00349100 [Aphelenchoides besseyi]|nr:hypothetical protein M3Y94_00349100 [Aphelenchoides besseyi]KAI6235366.1 hypothetical protein M3Y95_00044100 [Aphelenchoides besseyi]
MISKHDSGRVVPSLLWDLEDENNIGPLINDIFFGCSAPLSPKQPRSVVFVGLEQDNINGGFYTTSSTVGNNRNHSSTFDGHYSSNLLNEPFGENKWLDDYVDMSSFGHSTNVSTSNHTNDFHPSVPSTSTSYAPTTDYHADLFYNEQSTSFYHQKPENGISTAQFSHLNLQEPQNGLDNTCPPVPESEYSASYSAPGSAYSSDWSSGSEQLSALSQDEILEEIHRECAEIERQSVSPVSRRSKITKKRNNQPIDYVSPLPSTSSTGSLAGSAGNSDRKKELNRIAATKYREKKRRERDSMHVEHKELEVRNRELKTTMKELRTEIDYLRKLMKDMEERSKR